MRVDEHYPAGGTLGETATCPGKILVNNPGEKKSHKIKDRIYNPGELGPAQGGKNNLFFISEPPVGDPSADIKY